MAQYIIDQMNLHQNKIDALKRSRKQSWPESRESREIIGENETMKMDPRRDQSRGLESRLQALICTMYPETCK